MRWLPKLVLNQKLFLIVPKGMLVDQVRFSHCPHAICFLYARTVNMIKQGAARDSNRLLQLASQKLVDFAVPLAFTLTKKRE